MGREKKICSCSQNYSSRDKLRRRNDKRPNIVGRESREGSERHSQNRSHSSSDQDDINTRLDRPEFLLEAFLRKTARVQDEKRIQSAVRSDCIPEFEPGKSNLSARRWLEKIDQLIVINENATIYHMQNRLTGLAKEWYSNLSD